MEVGKLYKTTKLYWMLYPSARGTYTPRAAVLSYEVEHRACSLEADGGDVTYLLPNSMFMVLDNVEGRSLYNKRIYRVLTDKGLVGWIYLAEWAAHDLVKVEE